MKNVLSYCGLLTASTLFISSSIFLSSCRTNASEDEELYTQHVLFPETASLDEKVDMVGRLVPSATQLKWQKLELTAFLHYGMNTFTDQEWGDGTESPELYNPTSLDTDQWIRELKDAGFNMVILTAKHHDGFCLWDTKTTPHSVKSSPAWKDGKGDVMAQLRTSCDKYDMRLGVYLSPWDRNNPTYGTGKAYNDLYLEQLRELLTNYGKIDEVWFDGANGEGPNGKIQQYDWDKILSLIQELQPEAVTAIMGKDVRWVGNEKGLGRATEWSATPLAPQSLSYADSIHKALTISPTSEDLGSRDLLEKSGECFWYPSEVDTSIRPGWFYHENELPKSLAELAHIYFSSVGMNSTLLLNIPPNKEGKLSDEDVYRIREFGDFVKAFNSSEITTQTTPYEIDNTLDTPQITVDIDPTWPFDAVLLQEDITYGQRVESFTVEALIEGVWQKIADGTTIGYKRILLLNDGPLTASQIRVSILGRRGDVNRLRVGAFKVPSMITTYGEAMNPTQGVSAGVEWQITDKSVGTFLAVFPELFNGIIYTPNADNRAVYYLVKKMDGSVISEGEFGNILNNPIPQTIKFNGLIKGKVQIQLFDSSKNLVQVPTSSFTAFR